MKRFPLIFCLLAVVACNSVSIPYGQTLQIDRETLVDKIKGGWYAQTIGCTYGGPTEFKFKGGLMQDGQPIIWYEDYIADTYVADPGLFDDVYMDLTFLEVMSEMGVDAPVDEFASRFANAPYKLWHANQAARYNILNGRGAPESGYWKYNPHADDIDFQIEADFIGMLTPGRPNDAAVICDRIGHIMNYGDGWYGGVYIAAMYSLAYVCDDIETIVREAAAIIPEGTKFRSCLDDVIAFYENNPKDWKACWFAIDQKHSFDFGCPEGVWNGFNIDARINSAYVVISLLYGGGDFRKTMDIATRCGQDSDCNPASAAGILGVIYGYDALPDEFKRAAEKIQDLPFPYTTLSLNTACQRNLELMGLTEEKLEFTVQKPRPVVYEQSFEGIKPVDKVVLKKRFSDSLTLDFKGNSIVVEGSVVRTGHDNSDYVAHLKAFIDGQEVEDFNMPTDYLKRKYEIFSIYCLTSSKHTLELKLLNPHPDYEINAQEMVVYDED